MRVRFERHTAGLHGGDMRLTRTWRMEKVTYQLPSDRCLHALTSLPSTRLAFLRKFGNGHENPRTHLPLQPSPQNQPTATPIGRLAKTHSQKEPKHLPTSNHALHTPIAAAAPAGRRPVSAVTPAAPGAAAVVAVAAVVTPPAVTVPARGARAAVSAAAVVPVCGCACMHGQVVRAG